MRFGGGTENNRIAGLFMHGKKFLTALCSAKRRLSRIRRAFPTAIVRRARDICPDFAARPPFDGQRHALESRAWMTIVPVSERLLR